MGHTFYIFAIALLLTQVKAQLCVSPTPAIVTNPLNGPFVAPQVVATPVVATTIVDNSVSNALANALQLLIVSDLIQSRLSPILAPNALLTGLPPVLERAGPIYSPVLEVVPPCATPIEVAPPCLPVLETIAPTMYAGVTETLTPNIYGGYTETICPNTYVTETILPNCYGGWTEAIAPTPCITEFLTPNIAYGQNIATVSPNIYGGMTEVISASPYVQVPVNNLYGYTEVVAPNCGPNFYGAEVVAQAPYVPNYYGSVAEVIAPSFNPGCIGGVTEVISNPYNFYAHLPEVITQLASPCIAGLPEVIAPNYYGGLTEVLSPITFSPGCGNAIAEVLAPQFYNLNDVLSTFSPACISNVAEIITPNPYGSCYGGVKEVNPFAPVAAEVLFPQAIPAQLTCNFGYIPTTVPCVSVAVEPLAFDTCGCGCNNYAKGFYF